MQRRPRIVPVAQPGCASLRTEVRRLGATAARAVGTTSLARMVVAGTFAARSSGGSSGAAGRSAAAAEGG